MSEEKIFRCKSTPINWNAENTVKNNTVRDTTDWDFDKWKSFVEATHIQIVKMGYGNDTSCDSLTRKILHKCVWNKLAIITYEM